MDEQKIIEKIRLDIKEIGSDLREFPGTLDGMYFKDREKKIKLAHIYNWTQSFFTGMAYWAYVETKDKSFITWMEQFKDEYFEKVTTGKLDTMHDLGFLYMPYAVALWKATKKDEYKDLIIKSSEAFMGRYVEKGKYIKAWGRMDGQIPDYVEEKIANDCFFTESDGLMIIDCMMNIPLLLWATKLSGDKKFEKVALEFSETTIKYLVRDDFSVCHAYRFNEETGEPIGEENYCGFSVGSHWSRGTTWAIYGFLCVYKFTKQKRYLDYSVNILKKFIKECKGDIPLWDFRKSPENERTIDTSAPVIALSACNEILRLVDDDEIKSFAETMPEKVEKYVNYDLSVNGILGEVDGRGEYTSMGDYYLVEWLFSKKHPEAVVWFEGEDEK